MLFDRLFLAVIKIRVKKMARDKAMAMGQEMSSFDKMVADVSVHILVRVSQLMTEENAKIIKETSLESDLKDNVSDESYKIFLAICNDALAIWKVEENSKRHD